MTFVFVGFCLPVSLSGVSASISLELLVRIPPKFSARVDYACGSAFFWRCCDTVSISDIVNDVIFPNNRKLMKAKVEVWRHVAAAELAQRHCSVVHKASG